MTESDQRKLGEMLMEEQRPVEGERKYLRLSGGGAGGIEGAMEGHVGGQ